MPPFDNAPSFYKVSTLSRWYNDAVPELHDPELLWDVYWKRFNTMPIPILPYNEYFEKALEIAKVAKDKEEFERIFEERNAQAWKELQGFMLDASYQTVYNKDIFPCEDALRKVKAVARSGYLMDFIQLLKGSAFGWEADEVRDARIDNVPSGEEALVGRQADVDSEYTDQGESFAPEMLDWDELVAKSRAYKKALQRHGASTASASAPREASDAAVCADGDRPTTQQDTASSRTASNSEGDRFKGPQDLQRKRKRVPFGDDVTHAPEPDQSSISRPEKNGSVIGEPPPLVSDNDRGHKRRRLDDSTTMAHINVSSEPNGSISKKRPLWDGDGEGDEQRPKRQKLDSSCQQLPETEPNASRINKRSICDDDDDDDDLNSQGHKRQKLDSSSQQHANTDSDRGRIDKSMSKKRSRCDNDNDNDIDDNTDDDEQRHKRQRLDSSSQRQAEADTKRSRPSSKQRSSRSRRKRGSANSAPENIRTRSLNRIRPSTFWELDHTGKASIRI
ncbi:hypothetical protein V8C44DRAFT_346842 [Trichoderma aethiopicum]